MSSLVAGAVTILSTGDTTKKAELTSSLAGDWLNGNLDKIVIGDKEKETPPLEPARPSSITLVEPKNAPKRGKGGKKYIIPYDQKQIMMDLYM